MRIARVFPTRTSMSPQDPDAYFGLPEFFMPEYDEVHISVTFTWDIEKAEWLKKQWEGVAPVKVGGVAIDGEGNEFIPGRYVKEGAIITSRGCPNNCSWCFIDRPLQELEVKPGNNILDNNILACSDGHLDRVFEMLATQKDIVFSGGLEASRITDKIAERLRKLRIKQLFLAYDHPSRLLSLEKATQILQRYFNHQNYLRCYVLVGFGNDTPKKAVNRLIEAYEIGTLPFAMLYRDKDGEFPKPYKEWRKIQHTWTRPAAIRSLMKEARL